MKRLKWYPQAAPNDFFKFHLVEFPELNVVFIARFDRFLCHNSWNETIVYRTFFFKKVTRIASDEFRSIDTI